MTTLHIDFETRSTLDLKVVGLYNYARHPSTDVWCMAWSFDDDEPQLVTRDTVHAHYDALNHVIDGGKVVAHNAPFELAIWNNTMAPRYGWPVLQPEQTYCTMAMCYAMGLPGALEDAALALGLHILKDTEGRNLMLRMARPRSVDPVVWWDDPEKLNRLYEYCKQDVRVERELEKRLMPLSEKERQVWLLDYKINQCGVAVDVETARAAVTMAEKVKEECSAEIARITGGAVQSLSALAALKDWLSTQSVVMESVAKQSVVDALGGELPANVRQVLTLRQEAGKTSVAKLGKMLNVVGEDGRLRNMYQYHGAGTGRWAGRTVQPHNLPRDMPSAEAVEIILDLVRRGEHKAIDAIYGPPLTMISKCMRSFFVAPPGKLLVSGDWSNVEGRGQAWFAGEEWKLQAFRAADEKRGPGIYELTYAKSFGVPVESVKNPSEERQVGKVMELAFGYQGGVGSFHVMAKNYGVKVSDAKADEFKNAWRQAHPKIKAVWRSIEAAAIAAVRQPGNAFACGEPGRQAKYKVAGSFLWCLLPSGRVICYPYPKIMEGQYGPQLTYMCVPSPEDKNKGGIIHDPKNASNWARVSTYGGSLFNNIVQGFCRDFLADGLLAIDAAGGAVVLHTHDDINLEVDEAKGEGAVVGMKNIMCAPPDWAKGFPLVAKPALMARYGK